MDNFNQKLERISSAKEAIKTSLTNKGMSPSDNIEDYAQIIDSIKSDYYNARLVPMNGKILSYITEISTQLDTSSVTNMTEMFAYCTNLQTIPLLDTSSVTNMAGMFRDCTNLTTIPLLDTSKVTNMTNMFNNCTNLTDESLNNILAMCANATSYTGTKTLKYMSLIEEQATKCTTLSNYEAFTAAGWTTGY